MNDALKNDIRLSPVIVHPGRYAYLTLTTIPTNENFFMVSRDADEVTVVAEEGQIAKYQYDAETKWFKLIEIKTASPFLVPGFIAAITDAIASKGLTVLVISTYSKDYFLVREQEIENAVAALRSLGFLVND